MLVVAILIYWFIGSILYGIYNNTEFHDDIDW
jgi:hypothetical protein